MPVLKIRKDDGTWQEVWGGLTDAPSGSITEQVQADWNEADTTSPAYIKNKPDISSNTDVSWDDIHNKPFGETTELVDLLPTTQFDEFSLMGITNLYGHQRSSTYDLILGETYKVAWDGHVYECVAQDVGSVLSGTIALGNCSAFGFVGNDEPFIIARTSDGYEAYFSLTDTEAGGSHTVSISKKSTVIKTIDPKYLPNNIGGGGLPEITAEDEGKFLRVVNGVWCAVSIPNAEGASF